MSYYRRPRRLFRQKASFQPGHTIDAFALLQLQRMNLSKAFWGLGIVMVLPWGIHRMYWYLDRLPIWKRRMDRRFLERESFDFMVQQYAERE